jgi:hypothetical protein
LLGQPDFQPMLAQLTAIQIRFEHAKANDP